jgi:hypothetical protein
VRVLHYQHNGVGVILSEAMRELGIDSRVVATAPHPFGFQEDELLPDRRGVARALRTLDWLRLSGYDVFHCHDTEIPRTVQRLYRGKIVQHYHAPSVATPAAGADLSFTSLPGVIRQISDAEWIPLPCRTRTFSPELRRPDSRFRIGYSAQTLDPKKTPLIPFDEIASAVAELGDSAEAVPLAGVSHVSQMPAYYAGIDVWVDRFGAGFYGFAAIEAAAMGIPVVTEIGDFEKQFVPECPFVSIGRGEVTRTIVELAFSAARDELGMAGRTFVEQVHDSRRVAELCLKHYRKLPRGPQ